MQKFAKILTQIVDFFYPPFQKFLPKQVFRYGACGGGNMVLDWVLYFVIYNFVIGHDLIYINLQHLSPFTFHLSPICLTPHIATLCIVFPITLLTGFWLNRNITFTQSSLRGRRQLLRYISVVALNLVINYFGLKLCVEIWGWYPTPSKIFITFITVIVSFFCQKYFTFKR